MPVAKPIERDLDLACVAQAVGFVTGSADFFQIYGHGGFSLPAVRRCAGVCRAVVPEAAARMAGF